MVGGGKLLSEKREDLIFLGEHAPPQEKLYKASPKLKILNRTLFEGPEDWLLKAKQVL